MKENEVAKAEDDKSKDKGDEPVVTEPVDTDPSNTPPDEVAKNATLVKYMGSSDIRIIKAGETFGGRVSKEAVKADLVWSPSNNHVLDVHGKLSAAALKLLLDDSLPGKPVVELPDGFGGTEVIDVGGVPVPEDAKAFVDVTELDAYPTNLWQELWGGVKASNALTVTGVAGQATGETTSGEGAPAPVTT